MRKNIRWIFVAFAIGLLAVSGISAGRPSKATGIARAIEVANDNAAALLDGAGINGVGASLDANGVAVVLVLLEEPGAAGVPRELDGVKVVTRVVGKIVALNPPPPTTTRPAGMKKRPIPPLDGHDLCRSAFQPVTRI